MTPSVRFAHTSDDVGIAFWEFGAGPPLVITPFSPYSHVELEWQDDAIRDWYERLGEFATVVRYDSRGTGLSTRHVDDVSLEAMYRDLVAVVDAVDGGPASVMGVFHTGPAAVLLASRRPESVERLICWCTYAKGEDYWISSQSEALRGLRQTDYGLFLKAAAHELFGWSRGGEADRFAALMRQAAEPEDADRLITATREFDVAASLGSITAPTLVLHRRDLQWLDVNLSRQLATRIPGSQLVILDGDSPHPVSGDVAEVTAAIAAFLDVEVVERTEPHAGLRVVLFTDLVAHTDMMTRLDDDLGRDVLRIHESITRRALRAHGGTEVKSLGDGFMAWFASVKDALGAAQELRRSLADHNADLPDDGALLHVRIGMAAGEPVEEDDDLFGSTVILASRIMSAAQADEILVSDTVKGLSIGKGFSFTAHEDIVAKGFTDPIRVWSVVG